MIYLKVKERKGYLEIFRELDTIKIRTHLPKTTLAFITWDSTKPSSDDYIISFTKYSKNYLTSGCKLRKCRKRDDKIRWILTHEIIHKALDDIGELDADWDYLDKRLLISEY